MLDIAHGVVLEAFELALNLRSICHLRSLTPKFLHILDRVTKTLSCFSRVISIVAHAQPAELVAALTARHVHAALVLLDGTFALGARLCVDLHPVVRVAFIIINAVLPRG